METENKGTRSQTSKDLKTKNVILRLSPAERKILDEKAEEAGMSISSYIRKSSISSKPVVINPKEFISTMRGLRMEINKVGVNVNQATNYLNYLKNTDRLDDKANSEFLNLWKSYIEVLENLDLEFKNIRKKYK